FQVSAPIDEVWRFMTNPENVAACMPGASIAEIIDERSFVGNIKLKVGAVTAKYKGKIAFVNLDEATHNMEMVAEGKEPGGGTVTGTIGSHLVSLPDGGTEVFCESSIELTGKIMQVGRGMIEGVSAQLFKKFANNTKKFLEAPAVAVGEGKDAAAGGEGAPGTPPVAPPVDLEDSISILPLIFKTLWAKILKLFGFGK
ncbi:MAG: SRPBCC family protein, partial [Deltaproteobacteria bacterium]|nr:SRPBCC family protein [Deltaproteobacteria bacterium]